MTLIPSCLKRMLLGTLAHTIELFKVYVEWSTYCYLRASVGIGMAILLLEGIYPQIKTAKVLFKTKTNNLPLIFNSIFQTGRQCL